MPVSARRASAKIRFARTLDAFLDAVVKAKPSGVKGTYIKKLALTSTMGPGVRFDMNDLTGSAHDAAE